MDWQSVPCLNDTSLSQSETLLRVSVTQKQASHGDARRPPAAPTEAAGARADNFPVIVSHAIYSSIFSLIVLSWFLLDKI